MAWDPNQGQPNDPNSAYGTLMVHHLHRIPMAHRKIPTRRQQKIPMRHHPIPIIREDQVTVRPNQHRFH